MASGKSNGEAKKKKAGPSLLEWLSGAVGALLAIFMLGFTTYEALDESTKRPPLLQVEAVSAAKAGGSYIIEVQVSNRSGQTAAAVEVEGELSLDGQSVETSSATLSYVPGDSERTAGLVFTHDPRNHELRLRVTGYEQP